MKKINEIEWYIRVDGKKYGSKFVLDKEANKKDAEGIGVVLQKQITLSLEKIL